MYNKTLFSVTLMVGTLVAISSYTWMGMWMGLEINLLSLIPLMSESKNSMATEASLKYFVTQALASTLLLFSFILLAAESPFTTSISPYLSLVLNTALFTKMGAAPFHFWLPEVIEGLSWTNSAILLIWQKIAPMGLIMLFDITELYLMLVVLSSVLISGFIGLNQISLRKILAYSSINHIGWMLAALWFSETIWTAYFVVYTLITLGIINLFNNLKIFYLTQLCHSMTNNLTLKLFTMMNFLSLGGLPPFLGFFPKWVTILCLVDSGLVVMSILMILMTLMTLYFYIRVIYTAILLGANELSFHTEQKMSISSMYIFTTISVFGLILATPLFNYL
uniref:NADH-ubiquinone oxidoreductase chain 2 n=1 Tax=Euchirus longimanus TaxID=1968892 RepID=A0AAU6QE94_9SCAR